MKIFVDDTRETPKGYTRATNVNEVKILCCQHLHDKKLEIEEISLDHDAGDYSSMGGDYIQILNWLEEKVYLDNWKINTAFRIHSGNPVGRRNMERIIERNGWTLIY